MLGQGHVGSKEPEGERNRDLVRKERDIRLIVLLAVLVASTWKGESTHRSEISNLPENAQAVEIIDTVMKARKEERRVLVQAIANWSIESLRISSTGIMVLRPRSSGVLGNPLIVWERI